MQITVTDKQDKTTTGTGGGFIHNWTGLDGNTIDLGFHLELGDGSGEVWSIDEMKSVHIDFEGDDET